MKRKLTFLILILLLVFLHGCLQPMPTDNPGFTDPAIFGTEWLNSIIEVANAMSLANLASTPVNPYTIPIGVGLAGITAMLEALRRKERAGRKHAEHELNGNNKKK